MPETHTVRPKEGTSRCFGYWLILALIVLTLDQITKYAVRAILTDGETLTILPSFFNITLVYNTGAAFSFLADAAGWQRHFLTVLALIISVWIIVSLYRHSKDTLLCLPLTLILGGALGNVVDRILFGKVTDFIQVHYNNWYYPTFNIADSAITVAVILLLFASVRSTKKRDIV